MKRELTKETGARPKDFVTSTPLYQARPSDNGVGNTAAVSRYETDRPCYSHWTVQPVEPSLSPQISCAQPKLRALDDTRE